MSNVDDFERAVAGMEDLFEKRRDELRDRAGFTRRWGIHVAREGRGAPWVSVGLHLDWHTPTLDLYLFRFIVQIGRNQWDREGRFVYARREPSDGHTDQCLCWDRR